MKKILFIAISTMALFTIEAHAQMGGGGGGGGGGERPEFSELDLDANDSLSVEELSEFNADRADAIMSRMDTDEDGAISQEEWSARQERGAGGGMGGAGGMGMGG